MGQRVKAVENLPLPGCWNQWPLAARRHVTQKLLLADWDLGDVKGRAAKKLLSSCWSLAMAARSTPSDVTAAASAHSSASSVGSEDGEIASTVAREVVGCEDGDGGGAGVR